MFQILNVLFALVIAVGPVKGVKMSVLEVQRGFHEYTALHVHALALVLRCREEELPERHVARVQVYRTQAGRAVLFGDFEFDIVCPELDVDDGFAFHERLVAEESAYRGAPDFVDVVVREGEGEGL